MALLILTPASGFFSQLLLTQCLLSVQMFVSFCFGRVRLDGCLWTKVPTPEADAPGR